MKPILHLPFDAFSTAPGESSDRGISPVYTRDNNPTPGAVSSYDLQGNLVIVNSQILRWNKGANGKFYLAMEPSVTNFITDVSESFARWSKTGPTTVYSKTQIAPTGKYDADEVTFGDSTSIISTSNALNPASSTFTFSVWMKSASGTQSITLELWNNVDDASTVNFAVTPAWQRFSITKAFNATAGILVMLIINGDNSARTIHFYGAQVEALSAATSYIPTTPSFVTSKNLVTDANMELDDTSAWVSLAGGVLSKDTSVVRFGRRSLKIVASGDGVGAQQDIPTTIGVGYRISGWVYALSGPGGVQISFASGANAAAQIGQWTYFESCFKATATTTTFVIAALSGASTFYVDQIKIVAQLCPEPGFEGAGSPPTGWAMAGAGAYAPSFPVLHSGGHAGQVTCAAAADGIKTTQAQLSLAINTWYKIACWVYTVSRSGSTVFPVMTLPSSMNNGGGTFDTNAKDIVGSWQRLEVVTKTAGSISGTDALLFHQSAAGSLVFVIDDVSVVQVDNPNGGRARDFVTVPINNAQPSNLLSYSEDFTQSVWGNSNVTVTPNAAAAPDGSGNTASLLSFPTAAGQLTQAIGVTAGSTKYTWSIWLRAKTANDSGLIYISMNDGVSDIAGKLFQVSSTWRRYSFSGTSAAMPGTIIFNIHTLVPIPGIDLYAWGVQIQIGSAPTAYVKTMGTAQPAIFSNYASSNYSSKRGSVSFFILMPGIKTLTSGLFGDWTDNGLSLRGDTSQLFYLMNTKLKASGGDSQKSNIIEQISNISATSEYHIILTWDTTLDSAGSIVLRTKAYLNGVKKVDTSYTDASKWAYPHTDFIFAPDASSSLSAIRDLKVWPGPLTDSEAVDLFVAG